MPLFTFNENACPPLSVVTASTWELRLYEAKKAWLNRAGGFVFPDNSDNCRSLGVSLKQTPPRMFAATSTPRPVRSLGTSVPAKKVSNTVPVQVPQIGRAHV